MTAKELAAELGVSQRYIEHHFPKIKERQRKLGRDLVKVGKGQAAAYGIIEKGQLEARF